MKKIVTAIEKTRSQKVGDVSVTYAPVQSCPSTCRFLNNGCYAQNGHCGFTFRRLSNALKSKARVRPSEIAKAEAKAITGLSGARHLRLHVSGDCKTPEAAEILSNAADNYIKKHNKRVWTYTHSWDVIPRHKWGNISVIASCETFDEVKKATKSGYATCLTRYKPFDKSFMWNGYKMIPCLEQTRGINCDKCMLCMKDEMLLRNKSIVCLFSHGSQKNKINKTLKEL
jgi:hypothetical protein